MTVIAANREAGRPNGERPLGLLYPCQPGRSPRPGEVHLYQNRNPGYPRPDYPGRASTSLRKVRRRATPSATRPPSGRRAVGPEAGASLRSAHASRVSPLPLGATSARLHISGKTKIQGNRTSILRWPLRGAPRVLAGPDAVLAFAEARRIDAGNPGHVPGRQAHRRAALSASTSRSRVSSGGRPPRRRRRSPAPAVGRDRRRGVGQRHPRSPWSWPW